MLNIAPHTKKKFNYTSKIARRDNDTIITYYAVFSNARKYNISMVRG